MTRVWMPVTALEGEVLELTLTCHPGEAVNVDAAGRIFVLEATRHRLQVYTKVKDFEDASLNL